MARINKLASVSQIVSVSQTKGVKKANSAETNGHATPEETGVFLQAKLPDFVASPTTLDGVRQKVFLDRYSLKDSNGKPMELHPEQMWWRVANGIAHQEKTTALRKLWAEEFYRAMEGFKFVPGGRILSGAGTGFEVTFFNCYVIPSPKDSRGGIMENITHTVEIQARGGGVGINLSSLRPNGARVKKVNGTSSGPVSWASLYSAANHDVIQQGGSRRGALMLMLHDWHPDIIEFIHVKEDLTKIPGANLSICISDKFMEAVEKDENWVTKFADTSDPEYDNVWDGDIEKWESLGKKVIEYGTYKAKDIWDQICNAAWRSAEPGLHFLERSNKWGNTWYFEKLLSTNPSLRAGTRVLTKDGIFPIEQLQDKKFLVKNLDGQWSEAECFLSGNNKELYKVTLDDGEEIFATAEHKWPVSLVGGGFGKVTTDELKAGNILPFPKAEDIQLDSKKPLSKDEGFMVGWLYGDGWISERSKKNNYSQQGFLSAQASVDFKNLVDKRTILHALDITRSAERTKKVFGFIFSNEDKILADVILEQVNKLKREKSSLKKSGNTKYDNTHVIQATSAELAVNLSQMYGVDKKEYGLPSSIWKSGSQFIKGMVDGLISSDGFVAKNANRIVLTTKHKKIAHDFSDLMSFYGIKARIRRSEATNVKFPNQKEYSKVYERFDVTIDGYNAVNFAKIFTVSHPRKQQQLQRIIAEYQPTRALPDYELIRIVAVEKTDLKEDVWDISVYDDTHCFYINHCITGNCGEQPLGAWAVCNLGAMNLSAFVKMSGEFDYDLLDKTTRTAMRFMDNVVDANYYFYHENEEKAKEIRRTGIGTMGLGDALIKMKLKYGSDEGLVTMEKIYGTIRDAAYETSSDLAKEKGSFPKFETKKYLQGHFIQQLPKTVQDKIAKQGIRNAVILTQAPTGTTSLISGVSSGIEPVYDFAFVRKDRTGTSTIYHPLYQAWKDANPGVEKAPDYFVAANDLTPEEHVKVQAMAQKYTDSSISKTVNAPNAHSVEDVKKLYTMAYKLGLKGVTYFRDGSRTGVLSHIEEKKEEKKEETNLHTTMHRPMILAGRTYKMQTPLGEAFVTINRDEQNQPFEVFITIGKGGMHTMADAEAIGRLVTLSLKLSRSNGKMQPKDVAQKVIAQLRGIGGASHVGFGKDRVMSLADAIAKTLAEDISLNEQESKPIEDSQEVIATEQVPLNLTTKESGKDGIDTSKQLTLAVEKTGDLCPECGAGTFVMEEGCQKCYSCGYSKC